MDPKRLEAERAVIRAAVRWHWPYRDGATEEEADRADRERLEDDLDRAAALLVRVLPRPGLLLRSFPARRTNQGRRA